MDGMQLLILGFQLVVGLLLFGTMLHVHRRTALHHAVVRQEITEIRAALAKLLSESETGYYDLLQTVEAVGNGVKKTASLVLTHTAREPDDAMPPMSVLDKKHLATALHDQGLTPDEISTKLDIPRGELALMLRMSERRVGP